jgi:hypothetical protein
MASSRDVGGEVIDVPVSGQCFVCGKPGLTPGSFCVPCKSFVCWSHKTPETGTRTARREGRIIDHSRCEHG